MNNTSTLSQVFPGNLPRELPHNFLRDAGWTVVSALNINTAGRVVAGFDTTSLTGEINSTSFVQPMAAQWLYGTAPMLLLATGETIYRRARGEELTSQRLAQIWTPAIAASAAIPMWDLAQIIGTNIGAGVDSATWYGASIAAGMIAAPLTGVFEGFTQFTVKYLADVATNPVTREMWRQDSGLMGKLLAKDLALNVTIGAIPGAVWQIIFFFVLPALMVALGPVGGIILAALLIALAVMLCNLICTHIINKVSQAIDRYMGWDSQFKTLMQSAERALKLHKKAVRNQPTETGIEMHQMRPRLRTEGAARAPLPEQQT